MPFFSSSHMLIRSPFTVIFIKTNSLDNKELEIVFHFLSSSRGLELNYLIVRTVNISTHVHLQNISDYALDDNYVFNISHCMKYTWPAMARTQHALLQKVFF